MHISKVMIGKPHMGDSVRLSSERRPYSQPDPGTLSSRQSGACCDLFTLAFSAIPSFLAAQPADLTLRQRMRAEACMMERTHDRLDVGKAPDNRCTSKSFSIRPPSQCMANIEDRVAYGQGVL